MLTLFRFARSQSAQSENGQEKKERSAEGRNARRAGRVN
jgi:hypothetical protein